MQGRYTIVPSPKIKTDRCIYPYLPVKKLEERLYYSSICIEKDNDVKGRKLLKNICI